MHLQSEIAQQPAVLKNLLDQGRPAVRRAAKAIQNFNPSYACIAARGTSSHAARYAQYLFGSVLRLPVMLAAPSLHTIYDSPPDLSHALVIGISQSGQAEDVGAVLRGAKKQGALALAITNFEDSPLAATAQHHLPLLAGEELSVAATKTYTAQLTVIAMLAARLADSDVMAQELTALPRLAREALDLSAGIADWAERYRAMEQLVVLGRGYNYATASEISLKVKELTYIASEGCSEAEFRHGPIAVIQPGYPVILVAPPGRTFAGMAAMSETLTERQAETLIISSDSDLLRQSAQAMPIPAAPEWLSPTVSVMPGQIFAMEQARARGLNIDKPRGLSKVTITE